MKVSNDSAWKAAVERSEQRALARYELLRDGIEKSHTLANKAYTAITALQRTALMLHMTNASLPEAIQAAVESAKVNERKRGPGADLEGLKKKKKARSEGSDEERSERKTGMGPRLEGANNARRKRDQGVTKKEAKRRGGRVQSWKVRRRREEGQGMTKRKPKGRRGRVLVWKVRRIKKREGVTKRGGL